MKKIIIGISILFLAVNLFAYGGDSLGNHKARRNLDVNDKNIDNINSVEITSKAVLSGSYNNGAVLSVQNTELCATGSEHSQNWLSNAGAVVSWVRSDGISYYPQIWASVFGDSAGNAILSADAKTLLINSIGAYSSTSLSVSTNVTVSGVLTQKSSATFESNANVVGNLNVSQTANFNDVSVDTMGVTGAYFVVSNVADPASYNCKITHNSVLITNPGANCKIGIANNASGNNGLDLDGGAGNSSIRIKDTGNIYFGDMATLKNSTFTWASGDWGMGNNLTVDETATMKNVDIASGTINTLSITGSLVSPVEYSTVTLLAVFTSTGNTTASMNTQYVDLPICFDFTPKEWECWANTAGTFTISLTTASFANTPVFGNSIAGTDSPNLAGTQCSSSSALSGWGGNIPQGYCLRATVTSAATIDQVTLKVCVWKRR